MTGVIEMSSKSPAIKDLISSFIALIFYVAGFYLGGNNFIWGIVVVLTTSIVLVFATKIFTLEEPTLRITPYVMPIAYLVLSIF